MDGRAVVEFLRSKGVEIAEDVILEMENQIRADENEIATKRQKSRDIKAAICAFLELRVSDQQIFSMLSDYFEVDSITDAKSYIADAKKSHQIISLRKFCENEGMSSYEFRQYAKEHDLEKRLKTEPKLLNMSTDKLKALLDKEIYT